MAVQLKSFRTHYKIKKGKGRTLDIAPQVDIATTKIHHHHREYDFCVILRSPLWDV